MDAAAAREQYHRAELRLRQLLFGDVYYGGGRLKGEESRAQATAELRRMRTAFDDLLARSEAQTAERDLAEDLRDEAQLAANEQRLVNTQRTRGSPSRREDRPTIDADTMTEEMLAAARELAGSPWSKIRPRVRGNDREKAEVRDRLIAEGRLVNRAARKGAFELWLAQ